MSSLGAVSLERAAIELLRNNALAPSKNAHHDQRTIARAIPGKLSSGRDSSLDVGANRVLDYVIGETSARASLPTLVGEGRSAPGAPEALKGLEGASQGDRRSR